MVLRLAPFALLAALSSAGATARADEGGVAPASSALRFGRLELDLPAGWLAQGEGRTRQLLVPGEPNATVLVFDAVPLGERTLDAAFAELEAQVDRGREVVQRFPAPKEGGTTRQGFPVRVRGARTRDAQGRQRLALHFAIAAGSAFQVVTLVAGTPEAFKALGGPVGALVEGARVSFPAARDPVPTPAPGVATTRLAHVAFVVPPALTAAKREDDQPANVWRFSRVARVGPQRTAPIEVRVDLQPFVPPDTRGLLATWLRAGFGVKVPAESKTEVVRHQDVQLPGGLLLGCGVYEDRLPSGWVARRAGCVVLGPGWSLWVGAAVGSGKVWDDLDGAGRKALGDALLADVLPAVWALATSVTWDAAPELRPELVRRLIQQKQYRWRSTYRSVRADFSFYSSHKVGWTFFPDQTCTRETDGFTHVQSDSPGARGGTDTIQTFLTDEKPPTGRPRFWVVGRGEDAWIVVRHGGLGRLHPVRFDAQGSYGASKDFRGLSIDGQIEGTYESGDNYEFRKKD